MAVIEKEIPAGTGIVPLTVEQYHRMIETGILSEGEPIELLDGLLVPKVRGEGMTVNPKHARVVNRFLDLVSELRGRGCHFRAQSPVSLPPYDEPEPDGAIARGSLDDYTERHPGPEDLSCVIEVADTSLTRDRTTKQRIYAGTRVPQYLIVDLAANRIEVYEDPDPEARTYRSRRLLTVEDEIPLRLPGGDRLIVPARPYLA
jgi:Uma2 family endonuclease